MNNWQSIGYIFLGLGAVILVMGLISVNNIQSEYQERIDAARTLFSWIPGSPSDYTVNFLESEMQSAISTMIIPYVGGAIGCWVVAAVGLLSNKQKTKDSTDENSNEQYYSFAPSVP